MTASRSSGVCVLFKIRGGDAVHAQTVHLILHQRDERRHDQRESLRASRIRRPVEPLPPDVRGRTHHDRRRLKTERLAAAGRQDDDAVAAIEDGVHRVALQWTEVGEAPDAVERVEQDRVVLGDQAFLA